MSQRDILIQTITKHNAYLLKARLHYDCFRRLLRDNQVYKCILTSGDAAILDVAMRAGLNANDCDPKYIVDICQQQQMSVLHQLIKWQFPLRSHLPQILNLALQTGDNDMLQLLEKKYRKTWRAQGQILNQAVCQNLPVVVAYLVHRVGVDVRWADDAALMQAIRSDSSLMVQILLLHYHRTQHCFEIYPKILRKIRSEAMYDTIIRGYHPTIVDVKAVLQRAIHKRLYGLVRKIMATTHDSYTLELLKSPHQSASGSESESESKWKWKLQLLVCSLVAMDISCCTQHEIYDRILDAIELDRLDVIQHIGGWHVLSETCLLDFLSASYQMQNGHFVEYFSSLIASEARQTFIELEATYCATYGDMATLGFMIRQGVTYHRHGSLIFSLVMDYGDRAILELLWATGCDIAAADATIWRTQTLVMAHGDYFSALINSIRLDHISTLQIRLQAEPDVWCRHYVMIMECIIQYYRVQMLDVVMQLASDVQRQELVDIVLRSKHRLVTKYVLENYPESIQNARCVFHSLMMLDPELTTEILGGRPWVVQDWMQAHEYIDMGLLFAVRMQNLDLVEIMAELGANISYANYAIIFILAEHTNTDVINWLANQMFVDKSDFYKEVLMAAVPNGNISLIRDLMPRISVSRFAASEAEYIINMATRYGWLDVYRWFRDSDIATVSEPRLDAVLALVPMARLDFVAELLQDGLSYASSQALATMAAMHDQLDILALIEKSRDGTLIIQRHLMDTACRYGATRVATSLAKQYGFGSKVSAKFSALNHNFDIMILILKKIGDNDVSIKHPALLLAAAVEAENFDAVRFLVQKGYRAEPLIRADGIQDLTLKTYYERLVELHTPSPLKCLAAKRFKTSQALLPTQNTVPDGVWQLLQTDDG